ncbi:MAG: hypothetical protein PVH07_11895 [Chloroflexota bacterium]
MTDADEREHRVERSSHAIYGLIIITAALVADRQYAEDALTSLLALWGAALVLFLAHTYASLVAELGEHGGRMAYVERHVLIADNLPLVASVIVPSVLLILSGLGLVELRLAIDLSIVLSLASLFALGAYQARRQGAAASRQIAIGALGGLLGIVVIAAEVMLAH